MTFTELRTEAQRLYKEALADRAALDRELAKMSGVYTPSYILDETAKREALFVKSMSARADELKDKAESLIAEKRTLLDKMLSTAPTAEQASLLNTLALRGDDIDDFEYQNLAKQFSPNYQAIKALQAIAQKNGKRIPTPSECDYKALDTALTWAEKYLSDRVHGLRRFTTARQAHPFDRLFFGEDWQDNLYYDNAIAVLD